MKTQGAAAYRIRIQATTRLKPAHFVPGMPLSVHLPIPAPCETQQDIRILSMSPEGGRVGAVDCPQRTIHWQGQWQENPIFSVVYEYIHRAQYHNTAVMVPDAVQPTFDTQEELPHIRFSPLVRSIAETVTADALNNL